MLSVSSLSKPTKCMLAQFVISKLYLYIIKLMDLSFLCCKIGILHLYSCKLCNKKIPDRTGSHPQRSGSKLAAARGDMSA